MRILLIFSSVSTSVLLHYLVKQNALRKSQIGTTQECWMLSRTNPGSSPINKQQQYGYLLPITWTIQIRQTRHVGYCWWSQNELISEVLQRNLSHEHTRGSQVAKRYIFQFCADIICCRENLPIGRDVESKSILSAPLDYADEDKEEESEVFTFLKSF